MAWFEYNQNNSGGSFVVDDKVCHRLFIEARNKEEANDKAESLGVYFDGCASGMDCNCCGDRWSTPWDEVKLPYVYGTFTEEKAKRIADLYKVAMRKAKRKYPPVSNYDAVRTHEVVFDTLESYAQYLADEYGWTSPDTRLYYADGRVVEMNCSRLEAEKAKKKRK